MAFDQFLGCCNPSLDLTGRIEGDDTRAIEFDCLAPRRRPPCDRPVQFRIDNGGFLGLALQDEDVAELREDAGALGRLIADAERALHIERRASKLFGFLVTALLHQNTSEPDNKRRGHRIVLALLLEYSKQRAARIASASLSRPCLVSLRATDSRVRSAASIICSGGGGCSN